MVFIPNLESLRRPSLAENTVLWNRHFHCQMTTVVDAALTATTSNPCSDTYQGANKDAHNHSVHGRTLLLQYVENTQQGPPTNGPCTVASSASSRSSHHHTFFIQANVMGQQHNKVPAANHPFAHSGQRLCRGYIGSTRTPDSST